MIAIGIGLVLDLFFGDPEWLIHPVQVIGAWINRLEKLYYFRFNKRLGGGLLVVAVLISVLLIIEMLEYVTGLNYWVHLLFNIYAIYSGMAFASLIKIVKKVCLPLQVDDLQEARRQIGFFVSRDTENLTKTQIMKATIETLSENAIDGVIGPLFYTFLGQLLFGQGVLFLWLYKSINTMDSMIGYKNERYHEFGFFAAKLDDVINFLPARLGSVTLWFACILSGLNAKQGLKIMIRDHKNSASPNAGYPESLTAGALGIKLGGTYSYFGKPIEKPTMGDPLTEISIKHIFRTRRLLWVNHSLWLIVTLVLILRQVI